MWSLSLQNLRRSLEPERTRNMGALSKLSRIIKANVNDMLDRVENPEKMVKQLLSELKEGLREAEVETAKARKESTRVGSKFKESQGLVAEWDEKVVLALKNSNDSLAKEALKKKKEYEQQAETIKGTWKKQKETVRELEKGLEELQNKIREIESNKSLLFARQKQAAAKKLMHDTMNEIEEKLEPVVLLEEANATVKSGVLEEKFKQLQMEDLDKELQAIKEKM